MSRLARDVEYEVWRSGRDPDRLDPDRINQHEWNGTCAEDAVAIEMRRWHEIEQQRKAEIEAEEEYYRQQYEAESQAMKADGDPIQEDELATPTPALGHTAPRTKEGK